MLRSILVAIALGSAIPAMAHAQAYPERTVKIIVPFAPGGSTDVTAQILAEGLTKTFNQQVIVENKPGALGTIGVDTVAKSAAGRIHAWPERSGPDRHHTDARP